MAVTKSTIIILIFAMFSLLSHVSAKRASGSVVAFVYYGNSLPDKDPPAGTTGDLSDPYLKIWVDGNDAVVTKPEKNNLDPDIYERFYFLLYPGQQKLHLQFWDSDADSDKKDDLLLSATINLKTVCQTSEGDDSNAPRTCTQIVGSEKEPFYYVTIYKYDS